MSKQEAADLFLDVAEQNWNAELMPLTTSSEQAPLLGLGGSLVGMIGGISSLSGAISVNAADGMLPGFLDLVNSMSTMITTTLAGCFGAFLLIGLSAIANSGLARHLAELRMIATLMIGDTDNGDDEDENDDYLLSRGAA